MYCAVSSLHLNRTQIKRLDSIRRRSAAIIKGQSTETIRLTSIYDLTQSSTRNSQLFLRLPRFKLEVGKNSFKFMGAKNFNDIPQNVRQDFDNVSLFEANLKRFYSK